MSTIVSLTLDQIKNRRLTEEDLKMLDNAIPVEDEDCPFLTKEELKGFKPARLLHPEYFKNTCELDDDIYSYFSKEKNCSEKINSVLREYIKGENM